MNCKIYGFILLLCFSLSPASSLEFYDVYKLNTEGYNLFRIPALCQTDSGVLLAFAEGRKNNGYDLGDIDVVLRRSFDGGKNWGALQIVWDKGEDTCGNPVPVYDKTAGRIWLMMCHNKYIVVDPSYSSGNASVQLDGAREIWLCFSDDAGQTWSEPVDISDDVKPPQMLPAINSLDTIGPGRGIQLHCGPYAGRMIVPAYGRNIQSDDYGQSWTYSGAVGGTGMTNESTCAALDDGRLIRNDRPRVSYAETKRRLISYSSDYGKSWTKYKYDNELITPICHASMMSFATGDPASGSVLLFANPASTETRIAMTVRTSKDNGKSWGCSKLIYPDSSGYCSMEAIEDDKIGVLFENGDGWPYHRISLAIFSLDWLNDSAIAAWEFDEKIAGQKTSMQAGAIIDSRGYGLNGTAHAEFDYIEGSISPSSAINFCGKNYGITISEDKTWGLLDFQQGSDFVIDVVFKTISHSENDNPGAIIAKNSGTGNPQWWIRIENGKIVFNVNDGTNAITLFSSTLVNDGKWHRVTAGRNADRDRLSLYVDDKLEDERTDPTSDSMANDRPIIIGSFNNSTTRYFEGQIDYVRILRHPPQFFFNIIGDFNDDHSVNESDMFILLDNWLNGYVN